MMFGDLICQNQLLLLKIIVGDMALFMNFQNDLSEEDIHVSKGDGLDFPTSVVEFLSRIGVPYRNNPQKLQQISSQRDVKLSLKKAVPAFLLPPVNLK